MKCGRGYLVAALLCLSCADSVEVLFECPSPDGRHVATFFRVMGGGAAGWQVFRIDVRGASKELDPNRFVFELKRSYFARLEWAGDQTLEIGYPSNPDTPSYTSSYNDIHIELIEHPSDGPRFANSKKAGCFYRKDARSPSSSFKNS